MADLVEVLPGRDDGRVALFETHRDHPDGEAWVANRGQAVWVARTPLVQRKLASGELVEVTAQVSPAEEHWPPAKPSAPWEGYDSLRADQVIAKLSEVDSAGRAAVLAYEQSKGTRARKSIIDAAGAS